MFNRIQENVIAMDIVEIGARLIQPTQHLA